MNRPPSSALLLLVPLLAGCDFFMPNPYTTPLSVAMTATEVAVDERTLDEMGDDLKVKTNIMQALAGGEKNLFFAVSADVFQGDVLLTGAVKTAEDDVQAEAVVKAVPGVIRVYNELHITEDFGLRESVRDTGIELKVKFAVMSGAGFRYPNYRWRATHGTVYLFGIAQTEEEYDAVYDKVRGITEVERLITHIRIKAHEPPLEPKRDAQRAPQAKPESAAKPGPPPAAALPQPEKRNGGPITSGSDPGSPK
jgi:osmotically-inducible protein OsmY